MVLLRPENKITALEGESVYFECIFFGTQLLPFWKINSQNFTSYSTLPEGYSIKNYTKLLIEKVDLSMNNTQYSCGFSLYHGEIIESSVGYLAVIGTFYFKNFLFSSDSQLEPVSTTVRTYTEIHFSTAYHRSSTSKLTIIIIINRFYIQQVSKNIPLISAQAQLFLTLKLLCRIK